MKKYFNKADIIVFGITIVGISIIIGYKFFWTNTVPLLNNADITADIFYTISTSIVASGMFYLFTIYIPKYFQIKNMKLHYNLYIANIQIFNIALIGSILDAETNEYYTIEKFLTEQENNKSKLLKDFSSTFCNPKMEKVFSRIINTQINTFESILFSYSDILPKIICIRLNDMINLRMKNVNAFFKLDLRTKEILMFSLIEELMKTTAQLHKFK